MKYTDKEHMGKTTKDKSPKKGSMVNTGVTKPHKKTMDAIWMETYPGRSYQTDEAIAKWAPNMARFAWKVKGKYGPVISASISWTDGSKSSFGFQGMGFITKMEKLTESDGGCGEKDCVRCGCSASEDDDNSASEDDNDILTVLRCLHNKKDSIC